MANHTMILEEAFKIEIIEDIFYDRNAEIICGMPLHFTSNDDELIWNSSRNGDYLVKSDYYLTMEHIIDSANLHVFGDWNLVWKLNIS
ncbi:hypothetical protein JHK87_049949 [Glycine soja]|nr:hypothetical protein JHK87_049949 [Glycine soja]